MTSFSNASSLEFVKDITLHERRLKKEERKQVSSSHLESHIHILEPSLERPLKPTLENKLNNLMGEETPEKTLRKLYEPNVHQRPSIMISATRTNFDLRSNLISNLPIFRGSNGEDPHKHLRDFSWAYNQVVRRNEHTVHLTGSMKNDREIKHPFLS